MATKKVTITLEADLLEALSSEARDEGVPLSRLIASAAEWDLRRRIAEKEMANWEAEHGAVTPDELAAARAEIAAAEARYPGKFGGSVAAARA